MLLSFWDSAPNAPREVMLSHPDSMTSLFFSITFAIAQIPEQITEHWRLIIGLSGIFLVVALFAFVIFVIGFEIRYSRLSRYLMSNIYRDRENISFLTDKEAELFEALRDIQEEQVRIIQKLTYLEEVVKSNSEFIIGKK